MHERNAALVGENMELSAVNAELMKRLDAEGTCGDKEPPNVPKCKLCTVNNINAVTIPCGHGFCLTCLERWKEEKGNLELTPCPVCKRDSSFMKVHIDP